MIFDSCVIQIFNRDVLERHEFVKKKNNSKDEMVISSTTKIDITRCSEEIY